MPIHRWKPLIPTRRQRKSLGYNIQDEITFFDRFVAEHGEYDVLSDGAYARILSYWMRWVKSHPGERCVDFGCGTGAFTRRLRPFCLNLVGVDTSPVSVEHASRHADNERFVVGDLTNVGLREGSQDIVLYSGVLHHFPTREIRARVFAEGYRLLAPGGRLFAYDPNAHSPSMWLYRDPRSPLFSTKGRTKNEGLLRREDLEEELHAAGFDEVRVRGLSGITFRYVAGEIARVMLPLYNLYEHFIRLSPLEHRLGTFLISFARKNRQRRTRFASGSI